MDKIGGVADGSVVVAAAENGNATSLPGESQKDPGRCEGPYAGGYDHLLEARVHGRMIINVQ